MPLTGIIETVLGLLESFVPGWLLGGFDQIYRIAPILAFVIFVYFAYKSLKIAFHGLLVFTAAAIFPFFANYLLGTSIPTAIDSLLYYGLVGVILYLGYVFLGTITSILKVVTWPLRKLFSGGDKEVDRAEVEKMLEEED